MVISPLSIRTALSMIALGARGSTLAEIEQAFNLDINNPAWLEKIKHMLLDFEVNKVFVTFNQLLATIHKLCTTNRLQEMSLREARMQSSIPKTWTLIENFETLLLKRFLPTSRKQISRRTTS